MGSIDELTVTEHSDASKTPEVEVDKSFDDNEGLGDDSDEEPYFPFESRGKQKSQIAGNSTKAQNIRPVKQSKVDEAKEDKAKADKAKEDKAKADKAKADKAKEDKAKADKAKAGKAKEDKAKADKAKADKKKE